jgi:uncharacterized membrane protein YcaP (DUF421 family)
MHVINIIFGEGRDLNSLQMGCRALVMFFVMVALIRIAGMRTFGKKSAFDHAIVIMLGAILSRAVVGVSPMVPTLAATLVLAFTHRFVAWLSVYNKTVGSIFKGKKILLYKSGRFNRENMKHSFISEEDLMEGVRLEINSGSLESVEEIFMERTGELSIVLKNQH